MTVEEWTKVREEPYIPLGVWFSYYRECGGDIEDPITFEEEFMKRVSYGTVIIMSECVMKRITLDTAKSRLFAYYDKKFNIKQ